MWTYGDGVFIAIHSAVQMGPFGENINSKYCIHKAVLWQKNSPEFSALFVKITDLCLSQNTMCNVSTIQMFFASIHS